MTCVSMVRMLHTVQSMRFLIVATLAALVGVAGLAAAQPAGAQNRATAPAGGAGPRLVAEWGAELPAARAAAVLKQCTREVPRDLGGYWTPSADDVREMEPGLALALDSALASVAELWRRSHPGEEDRRNWPAARDYYRQYAGVSVGRRRLIYANGILRDMLTTLHEAAEQRAKYVRDTAAVAWLDPDYWRREPVVVCNGGWNFFGVLYDPATRRFGRVVFNDDRGWQPSPSKRPIVP